MTNSQSTEFASLLEQIESDPIEARELAAAELGLRAILTLQKAMNQSGMNQIDLATSLGVSESAVSQVLNGDGNLRMHTFARYLRALDFEATLELQPVDDGARSNSFYGQISQEAEGTSFEFSTPWIDLVHETLATMTQFDNSSLIISPSDIQLDNPLLWTPSFFASLHHVAGEFETHGTIPTPEATVYNLHLVA